MSAAKLSDPNYVLLYVQNPAVSVTFYEGLLGKPPVENSPTFAMFALQSGVMLGLWARHTVEPKALAAGGSELAFTLADAASVKAVHADWQRRGIAIAQPPTDMDFGHTCVGLDPDGHRLRAFAPAAQ